MDAIAALERGRRTRPRPITVGLLADALGLDPHQRTAFVEASAEGSPPTAPPLVAPSPLTTFIGREREVEDLRTIMRGSRLVTLTGAGGTGKTRLAVEVSRQVALDGERRAWFVPLDACHEPALVPTAIATALGIPEEPSRRPLAVLIDRLRGSGGLVVLDNCEHLRAAAAQVAEELLTHCPRLGLLATSRAVLGVAGELTWRIPPLRVPHVDAALDPEALAGFEAVRLFVDRATLGDPQFRLSGENAAAVAGICRRLDGIPLAIELAAARIRVLTPVQMLGRLSDASRMLTGGAPSAPRRQRTLLATIEWSCDLLAERDQAVFDRLSVFSGGFQLGAAEAVAGDDVLSALASLVDQSLVVAEPGRAGTMRFRLLEVLRQHGRARLERGGERDAILRRHAEHYLAVAQHADPELRRGQRSGVLPRLRLEHANFQAALEWGCAQSDDIGLRLATALGRYWDLSGSVGEGRRWLDEGLRAGTGDPALRATAVFHAGRLALVGGDYAEAESLMAESLRIKRGLGDEIGAARRLNALAGIAFGRGDPRAVRLLADQALSVMRGADDRRGIAWAHFMRGCAAVQEGDRDRAMQCYREAERLHRELDNPEALVYDLGGQAIVRVDAGDPAGARALAAEMCELVLRRLEGMADQPGWVWALLFLASAEERQPAVARLAGALRAMAHRGVRWSGALEAEFQPVVERAWACLGLDVAERLAAVGAGMSLEEVIAEGLGVPTPS